MYIEEVTMLLDEMQLMKHYYSTWKVAFFMDEEEMHTDFYLGNLKRRNSFRHKHRWKNKSNGTRCDNMEANK